MWRGAQIAPSRRTAASCSGRAADASCTPRVKQSRARHAVTAAAGGQERKGGASLSAARAPGPAHGETEVRRGDLRRRTTLHASSWKLVDLLLQEQPTHDHDVLPSNPRCLLRPSRWSFVTNVANETLTPQKKCRNPSPITTPGQHTAVPPSEIRPIHCVQPIVSSLQPRASPSRAAA